MAKERFVFTGNAQRQMLNIPDALRVNGAVAVQLLGTGAGVKLQATLSDANDADAVWGDVTMMDISTAGSVITLNTNGQLAWAEVPGYKALSLLSTAHVTDFTVLTNFREG